MERKSMIARTRAGLAVGASLAALAVSQSAHAQAGPCPDGQPGPVCVIDNEGDRGPIIGPNGTVTIVVNSGTITGAPAINMGGSVALFVDNESGGTITGTNGVAIQAVPRLFVGIDNSGTINGNVVINDAPAPNPFTGGPIYFISDGGILNGNLQLGTSGFSTANFIQRGSDDGVTGSITAGQGLDIYTRSYNTSQLLALAANALPATFEIEGFEALGQETVLTLTGAGGSINLSGNGSVVNTGTIGTTDTTGLYPTGVVVVAPAVGYYQTRVATFPRPGIPAGQNGSIFTVPFGNALSSFTNTALGVINGEVNLSTARFANAGDINLATRSSGSTIFAAADTAFEFDNSGSIAMAVNGNRLFSPLGEFETGIAAAIRLRSAINITQPAAVSITNSGEIVGGLDVKMAATDFVFENTGSIEGIEVPDGYFTPGVVLGVGELSLVAGQDPESHFDAATVRVVNAQGGTIYHGFEAYLSALDVTFENHGLIAAADGRPEALYVEQYLDDDDSDATSFSFLNTGSLSGNVNLDAGASNVSVENSGDITGQGVALDSTSFPELIFGGEAAFVIENETLGDQAFNFANSGDIINTSRAGSGAILEVDAGEDEAVIPATAIVAVSNSGTISATGGATIVTQQFAPFLEPGQFLANPLAGLVVDATDVPGSIITIENAAGGLIEAGGTLVFATPNGYNPVANSAPGAFTAALVAGGGTITITNSGTIRGGAGTTVGPNVVLDLELRDAYLAGAIQTAGDEQLVDGVEVYVASKDTLINTGTGVIIGSIDLGGADDTIRNDGSIAGAIYLRDGADSLSNYGSITGNLFFGSGNDTFIQGVNAIFDGVADGEDGEDSFFIDITGGGTIDQSIYQKLVNFELLALIGEGEVDVELGDEDDDFSNGGDLEGDVDLGAGDNEFSNSGTITGDVSSDDGSDTVANEGTIDGNVALGDGANEFSNSGTVTGNVTTGAGDDAVANDGIVQGEVALGDGANQFSNTGTIQGDVTAGSGADAFTNEGEIDGTVNLGEGSNSLANSGTINANVNSGDGDDEVSNGGTITGEVCLDADACSAPIATAQLLGTSAAAPQATAGGDDVFINEGLLDGNLAAGGGNDTITNGGTVAGNIDLGDGNDTLTLLGDWEIGGIADGGAGSDQLALALTGTGPAPLDLSRFLAFETLALSGSGTDLIQGVATFDQISLTGGRLIGAQGSLIEADIAVGPGATFGSAGQVTGNLSFASGSTLSPGASPAVMRVTGDVSLAAGSTTLFEFVPAPGQSDQLLIDGDLIIASGAVLNFDGNRPLTPGVSYDLIVADSITGQFTIGTWDTSRIQGFLRYLDGANDDRLQLLGTFAFATPGTPQAEIAIDYVNDLLIAGTASPALLGAISTLLGPDGFASQTAFAQLTPEPYAAAMQLGVENGLSLAKASRSGLDGVTGEQSGLFAFGSALGNWRSLDADSVAGTARAQNRNHGVLAGIGIGNAQGSIGAFVGYLDARQRLSALGAQTNADGMVAGVAGHLGVGGLNVNALIGYDWSEADTARVVPGAGASVPSRYDLESLIADAAISYDLPLGNVELTPEIGLTHINTRRSATEEAGSAAFGLAVDRDTNSATFIDGSVKLGISDGPIRPWGKLGVRHQLEGGNVFASGGFIGTTARFVVPGASREDTVLALGAGIDAAVADNVTVNASYSGEFGGGTGTAALLGLKIRF